MNFGKTHTHNFVDTAPIHHAKVEINFVMMNEQTAIHTKKKSAHKYLLLSRKDVMIAINIMSRAALGFSFASHAAEFWYVYHVRVSYSNYIMRFVGMADDVMDCIACFYSYKLSKSNE